MATYGQRITWRDRGGGHDRPSRQEARSDALLIAKDNGWTRPRWWQWWRWGDIDYEAITD